MAGRHWDVSRSQSDHLPTQSGHARHPAARPKVRTSARPCGETRAAPPGTPTCPRHRGHRVSSAPLFPVLGPVFLLRCPNERQTMTKTSRGGRDPRVHMTVVERKQDLTARPVRGRSVRGWTGRRQQSRKELLTGSLLRGPQAPELPNPHLPRRPRCPRTPWALDSRGPRPSRPSAQQAALQVCPWPTGRFLQSADISTCPPVEGAHYRAVLRAAGAGSQGWRHLLSSWDPQASSEHSQQQSVSERPGNSPRNVGT